VGENETDPNRNGWGLLRSCGTAAFADAPLLTLLGELRLRNLDFDVHTGGKVKTLKRIDRLR